MFFPEQETEMFEKIKVSCGEGKCKGFFTLNRWRDDYSPRVHGECSQCNRFMSVKLRYIDDSRIISREWL